MNRWINLNRYNFLFLVTGIYLIIYGNACTLRSVGSQGEVITTKNVISNEPNLASSGQSSTEPIQIAQLSQDTDRDGLTTEEEEKKYNTHPNKRDTDEDGLDDGSEVQIWNTDPRHPDTDVDGLNDGEEVNLGLDPKNDDTDADGLKDGQEVAGNTDPRNPDTDGDGMPDKDDPDPNNIPTPIPTPTVTSTPTPSPTVTPSPTPTDTPTPTPIPPTPIPTSTPTDTPTPTPEILVGRVAYAVGTGRSSRIYLLDLQTGLVKQLEGANGGTRPKLSPDGTKITWQLYSGGIFWQDFATGGITRVGGENVNSKQPAISSDGDKVAFIQDGSLYVWERGIDRPRVLAQESPSWKPDGNWIVYDSGGGYAAKVLITAPNNPTQPISDDARQLAWGPDNRIAFVRGPNIWVMNEDGSHQVQITDSSANDYDPAWSPDGTKIIFVSQRDGHAELYVINADGTNLRRIDSSTGEKISPSWGRMPLGN